MKKVSIHNEAFEAVVTKTIELLQSHHISVERRGLIIMFGENDKFTNTASGDSVEQLAEDLYIKLTQVNFLNVRVREMRLDLEQVFRPLRTMLSENIREKFFPTEAMPITNVIAED